MNYDQIIFDLLVFVKNMSLDDSYLQSPNNNIRLKSKIIDLDSGGKLVRNIQQVENLYKLVQIYNFGISLFLMKYNPGEPDVIQIILLVETFEIKVKIPSDTDDLNSYILSNGRFDDLKMYIPPIVYEVLKELV